MFRCCILYSTVFNGSDGGTTCCDLCRESRMNETSISNALPAMPSLDIELHARSCISSNQVRRQEIQYRTGTVVLSFFPHGIAAGLWNWQLFFNAKQARRYVSRYGLGRYGSVQGAVTLCRGCAVSHHVDVPRNLELVGAGLCATPKKPWDKLEA